jgi:hypothetical protein
MLDSAPTVYVSEVRGSRKTLAEDGGGGGGGDGGGGETCGVEVTAVVAG